MHKGIKMKLERSILVGSGCYGVVREFSKDKVIKVFDKEDHGYQQFLKFMVKASSKHLPKVFMRGSYDDYRDYVVIERLKPLRSKTLENKLDKAYDYHHEYETEPHHWEKSGLAKGTFLKTLKQLSRYYDDKCDPTRTSWDLHEGNVMLRGNTLVVTDPWG